MDWDACYTETMRGMAILETRLAEFQKTHPYITGVLIQVYNYPPRVKLISTFAGLGYEVHTEVANIKNPLGPYAEQHPNQKTLREFGELLGIFCDQEGWEAISLPPAGQWSLGRKEYRLRPKYSRFAY